jgi:triosephosphate isomerase
VEQGHGAVIRPLIAGNWKMHLDHVEAIHLTQQIGVLLRTVNHDNVDVLVIPPAVDLRSVSSVIDADRLPIALGAQHASCFDAGAYTGEISVSMLKRLQVRYVLVGHSERRTMFHMDDEIVASTFEAARRGGVTPIVCVGESSEIRDAREHVGFVSEQVQRAVGSASDGDLVIAYEPIWAIGTGVSAESADIAEMANVIRHALPASLRETTPILYGGSVKTTNAAEIARYGQVNGFLIGAASLKAEEFTEIVGAASECYGRTR